MSSASSARASRCSCSSSASEPLVAAGSDVGPPPTMLYAAIHTAGVLLAEAAVEGAPTRQLREMALAAVSSLQRAVSFVSIDGRPARGSRIGGVALHRLTLHVLRRHGHAFILLAQPELEPDLASRFCEAACSLFSESVAAGGSSTRRPPPQPQPQPQPPAAASRWRRMMSRRGPTSRAPNSDADVESCAAAAASPPEFAPRLMTLLEEHGRPERLRRLRRLREVEAQVSDVADIVNESIDRMLETRPSIDVLEQKSVHLLAQAEAFQRSARTQRREQCCRYARWTVLVGGVGLSLAAAVVLTVLHHLGKLW